MKATAEQIERERADDASAALAAASDCDPATLSDSILALAMMHRNSRGARRAALVAEFRRRLERVWSVRLAHPVVADYRHEVLAMSEECAKLQALADFADMYGTTTTVLEVIQ